MGFAGKDWEIPKATVEEVAVRIKLAVEGSEMSFCLGKRFFVEGHGRRLLNPGRMRSALEYHNGSANEI